MVAVAAPALVAVLLGLPLYENAQYDDTPVEVAKDEPIEVDGYTWTLVASGEFPHSADNEEVPEGLAVTAAIIQVRPGDDPAVEGTCDAKLTVGEGLSARRWLTLSAYEDYNYAVLDESTTVCVLQGEPFDFEVVYLAPEGTISDAVVEVSIGGLESEVVRFALTD